MWRDLVNLVWHDVIANTPHDTSTSDDFGEGESPINILPSSHLSKRNERNVCYLHTNTTTGGNLEVFFDTSWYVVFITPFNLSMVEFGSFNHLNR